jgi:hypothetical protein
MLPLLLQESQGSLPQVLWGVVPHDHTKCNGKEMNFTVPACLPAQQGEHMCTHACAESALTLCMRLTDVAYVAERHGQQHCVVHPAACPAQVATT